MDREGDDLLAWVIERPDEDAPRLMYADWLDRHGCVERAEFIRLQILQFRSSFLPPRDSLRLSDLSMFFVPRWASEIGRLVCGPAARPMRDFGFSGGVGGRWGWRRGFIETASLDGEKYLAIAPGLHSLCPLREVSLHFYDPDPNAAFGATHSSRALARLIEAHAELLNRLRQFCVEGIPERRRDGAARKLREHGLEKVATFA